MDTHSSVEIASRRSTSGAFSPRSTSKGIPMSTIAPCLWFDGQAEAAATFYTSIFRNSKVTSVSRNNGAVLMVEFELDGRPFMALNGGPMFKFTEAISMFVSCADQA